MNSKKILWLDDERGRITYLITHLKRLYELYIAESTYEAMDFLKTNIFNLIILDVMIITPNGTIEIDGKIIQTHSGIDTGLIFYDKWIKENIKDTPLIVYTNIENDKELENYFESKGIKYLPKATTKNKVFFETIEKILS
jgi:CheY-like chemotaxis protein